MRPAWLACRQPFRLIRLTTKAHGHGCIRDRPPGATSPRRAACHVEIHGPACKSALAGGRKTLFRFMGVAKAAVPRLAAAEAPIDALSLAALERCRAGTLYPATDGGMGSATLAALMSREVHVRFCEGPGRSNSPPSNGSTGAITGVPSSRSAISHPPRPKRPTMNN